MSTPTHPSPEQDELNEVLADHRHTSKNSLKAAIRTWALKWHVRELQKIRAEAYDRAHFELQAHAPGVLVDSDAVKWAVFEKYCQDAFGQEEKQ